MRWAAGALPSPPGGLSCTPSRPSTATQEPPMSRSPVIRCTLAAVLAAAATSTAPAQGDISQKPYGKTKDGKEATLYTLTNAKGMRAEITNYGGIVAVLTAPDRDGKFADVVLGFDKLD